jgi:arginine decarboxylase
MLEALADYLARDRYGFSPSGHRQGHGEGPRTITAIGHDTFRSDMLATAGLDDRTSSHGYLSHAEELMADAVGAEQAFLSTCGSSLRRRAAAVDQASVRCPLHLAHPPSPRQADEAWQNHPDAAGALIGSPTPTVPAPKSSPSPDICHRRGKP